MSQAISNANNIAFAGQALKYMQNGTLKEQSLFDEVKGSATSAIPFALAFDTIPTLFGASKIKKNESVTFIKALDKKTKQKLKSQGTQTHGKVAKFFKLDKLANWYSKTKFAGTKVGSLFKGASTMFLFTGLFELMEVIPAFKNGGVGAGAKQVVKSSANVVVDGLMYTAGAKIGATAGAAIGGPVGALIGGVGGMVLGGALNTLGRGLLDKVLGKNFSVKKQEQDMQNQAVEIAQDDAQLAQMKNAVQAQIAAKVQSGKELTDDDKQMLAMAQSVDTNGTQAASENTLQGAQSLESAQNVQGAQTQNADITQEEAELIARLQKVNNPQINYQIPDNFSVNA